jgi:hypothetical protein
MALSASATPRFVTSREGRARPPRALQARDIVETFYVLSALEQLDAIRLLTPETSW